MVSGEDEMEVLEDGEKCSCGGEINKLARVDNATWYGRCFQCGVTCMVTSFRGDHSNTEVMPIEHSR